ncbi:MAG: fluoride efflux transporter CrcB [Nocardioides sp.]|nr:fluoride efflux transporter CrcB [Nocardioides sp.]
MTALLVIIGGAIGAPVRYLTDLYVRDRLGGSFPWGTLVVNVVGAFVLGLVAGAASATALPQWALTLVGTGFCGALTTFSTFSYETVRLAEAGNWRSACGNVVISLAGGLAAVALGWLAGSAL